MGFGDYDGSVPDEIRVTAGIPHIFEVDDVTEKAADGDKPARLSLRIRSLTQPEADAVFQGFSDFKPDDDPRVKIMRQRELNTLCRALGVASLRDKAQVVGRRFRATPKWKQSGEYWNCNFNGVEPVSDEDCAAAGLLPF